eukprot:TRINITY_DN50801_c0_g1_i1.p1 TRINITY_DN50801_c0_g1~~TRINITY_DN50801_c0_g1_i1.p1  ORF type:complete len:395 (-),score=64.78 TRINITY_DN50801_c0_g1_i1:43-1227(-)
MDKLLYQRWVCLSGRNILLLFRQPKVYLALAISVPCGFMGGLLKFWQLYINEGKFAGVMNDNSAFAALTILVAFLLSFRVSTAYDRFWAGTDLVYAVTGDLLQAASSLFAFCAGAKASTSEVDDFQHKLVRLISLLAALIFAELEMSEKLTEEELAVGGHPTAYEFELIDIDGLDRDKITGLFKSEAKVEVVLQWIQQLIVKAWHNDVFGVPAPILSRAFQEVGLGMVHYHEALKITQVPFPFPYMIAMQLLMLTHWCVLPIVTAMWSDYIAWTIGFCITGTFSLWFFVGLALELEHPFGNATNCIDMRYMQRHLNVRLITLLNTCADKAPELTSGALKNLRSKSLRSSGIYQSLEEVRQSRLEPVCLMPSAASAESKTSPKAAAIGKSSSSGF